MNNSDVSQLLQRWSKGDQRARMPLIYEAFRQLASYCLKQEVMLRPCRAQPRSTKTICGHAGNKTRNGKAERISLLAAKMMRRIPLRSRGAKVSSQTRRKEGVDIRLYGDGQGLLRD